MHYGLRKNFSGDVNASGRTGVLSIPIMKMTQHGKTLVELHPKW